MKKLVSISLTIVSLCLIIASVTVLSFADSPRIVDELDYLTQSQKSLLEDELSSAEERTGIKFRVLIRDAEYVSEYEIQRKLGVDDTDSVILLIEDMGYEFEYEMFTYGDAYSDISDSDADDILDDSTVYSIKQGKLYEGALRFVSITADRILENRFATKIFVIVCSVVLTLLAAGGSVGFVIYKYKRKLKSPIYPISDYAKLYLDFSTDNFVNSFVTRTRVASSSGRGGRSSGGGSRGRR